MHFYSPDYYYCRSVYTGYEQVTSDCLPEHTAASVDQTDARLNTAHHPIYSQYHRNITLLYNTMSLTSKKKNGC